MFRTTYRQGRSRIHRAPVENRDWQSSTKANKKQTVFFALSSPVPLCPLIHPDPDDLPGLDGFEVSKAFRNEGREVFQQDGLSTKNDNRDLSLLQILLVFKSTIDGQDNVESRSLGCGQKLTILKSSKPSVSGSLAIVTRKVVAQSFAYALIEKNPHSYLGGKKLLSLLERSDSHLSRDCWVTFEELF
jgi:hypothetical protein